MSDNIQIARVTPVPLTARDVRAVVKWALAKGNPEFCRELLTAASAPSPLTVEASPSVERAYARARRALARYLAERDQVANLPPGEPGPPR